MRMCGLKACECECVRAYFSSSAHVYMWMNVRLMFYMHNVWSNEKPARGKNGTKKKMNRIENASKVNIAPHDFPFVLSFDAFLIRFATSSPTTHI